MKPRILLPAYKPTVRIPTLTSRVSQREVCCHRQSEEALGFRYTTISVEEKTIRTPVKTPPTNGAPLEMLAPKSHTSLANRLEAYKGGGDVEDRIRRNRQSPVTHANHEDTLNNIRSTSDSPSLMDLHEGLMFGNTTQTHRGAEGPPRQRPSLLLFHVAISLREMRESLWRHLLGTSERKLHVKASA